MGLGIRDRTKLVLGSGGGLGRASAGALGSRTSRPNGSGCPCDPARTQGQTDCR
jgi:hypothetical protein